MAAKGAVVGSGTNIAFVPDVGSSVRICLESETYVSSFSSEFLFSFELLNLYVFSMYALLLPFCSSRSAPPFPGLAPVIAACSYIYYYYYYYYSSSLPMGVYGSPMKGTWENDEIWHTLRYGHK